MTTYPNMCARVFVVFFVIIGFTSLVCEVQDKVKSIVLIEVTK